MYFEDTVKQIHVPYQVAKVMVAVNSQLMHHIGALS